MKLNKPNILTHQLGILESGHFAFHFHKQVKHLAVDLILCTQFMAHAELVFFYWKQEWKAALEFWIGLHIFSQSILHGLLLCTRLDSFLAAGTNLLLKIRNQQQYSIVYIADKYSKLCRCWLHKHTLLSSYFLYARHINKCLKKLILYFIPIYLQSTKKC
jgi:hypothetical protein